MSAHTPGSWKAGAQKEHGTEVRGIKGVTVAWCGTANTAGPEGGHSISAEEAHANAVLLAQAPRMFSLLEGAFGFGHERLKEAFGLDWYLEWCDVYDTIKGASS